MTHEIFSLAMFFLFVLPCLAVLIMSVSGKATKSYQISMPAGLENRRRRNLYKLEGQ